MAICTLNIRRHVFICTLVVAWAIFGRVARASQLSPRGTKLEQAVARENAGWWARAALKIADRGVLQFTAPVHEEITNRIFGCEADADICGDPDIGYATPFVIAGVRWNDDPPFRLEPGQWRGTSCKTEETVRVTTQPSCWYEIFQYAKKQAGNNEPIDATTNAPLLARSHFGDLQFLHAMASKDGELAGTTRDRVLMWAHFTWNVAHGDYDLATALKDVDILGFRDFFGKSGWLVQDLFTVGNPLLRPGIKDLAFGSLLHTVEDSFALGHVDRAEAIFGKKCQGAPDYAAPGPVREFHSYAHQNERKHGTYDGRNAFEQNLIVSSPNVIDVGEVLRGFYARGAKWEEVKPYLECVFEVADPKTEASAGEDFKE